MPEAWGKLVIRAPQSVAELLTQDSTEVSVAAMNALLKAAGRDEDYESGDGDLSLEGASVDGAYTVLQIFGDNWMDMAKELVEYGNGIELYGSIFDEFFRTEFYALSATGERFVGFMEADDTGPEPTPEQLEERWLSLVPGEVAAMDSYIFSVSNPEDEE